MFTKENTKIFIDTNIFLGLYNSNEAGNAKIFLHSLFKNKSILITTEQAINEYLRNRTRGPPPLPFRYIPFLSLW